MLNKTLPVLTVLGGVCLVNANVSLLSSLPQQTTVSVHGITWTFKHAVAVGTFVNHDFYVVGPCTVTVITPAPATSPAINGSVLNIPPADQGTAFDWHGPNYRPQYRAYPPINLKPGDALVSTISMDSLARDTVNAWLSPNPGTESWCKTAAVLTCLSAPVAVDAFRPSYCDRGQKLYYADSIRWNALPHFPHVSGMTAAALHEWSWHFAQSPWLDACFFGFDAPLDYMTHYSAETGRAAGIATLFLISDFSQAQKDSLMIGLVQYGIDLWGIVRGCNASRGWQAHGGHGTGRKWPMIFSGIMLGDTAMAKPTQSYDSLRIGEDMQTGWDYCWATRDSNFVYEGHQGIWNGKPVSTSPGWGPYENTPPSKWYCCESGYTTPLGESYRRCCTSHAWIAEALCARLMNAIGLWDHPEFFGYCDRWMTPSRADSTEIDSIKAERGWDFSADWEREGKSWDNITNQMWAAYRHYQAALKPSPSILPSLKNRLTVSANQGQKGVRIIYSMARPGFISIAVFDLSGNKIKQLLDGTAGAGIHVNVWDGVIGSGGTIGAGCYRVIATINGARHSVKLTIIK